MDDSEQTRLDRSIDDLLSHRNIKDVFETQEADKKKREEELKQIAETLDFSKF